MQTSQHVLAGRYGRALFLAAEVSSQEERVLKDLHEAHRPLLDAGAFFRNPRVALADKKKKLGELLGSRLSPLTFRFLELLVDKKRFELLPFMTLQMNRCLAEKKRAALAQVRSARALSAEERERLKKVLSGFSGKNVDLEIKEDPELIGGLVVRLGDWVLDGSLRGQIRRLKSELTAA